MKYIITEDQSVRLKALRRIDALNDLVDLRLKQPFTFDICRYGDNGDWFLYHMISWANEQMYYDYFSDIDDDTEEWNKIWNIYSDYITITQSKKIFDFYKRKCG